jgi:FemAB-related protein (PEP-CTERM system-associated)
MTNLLAIPRNSGRWYARGMKNGLGSIIDSEHRRLLHAVRRQRCTGTATPPLPKRHFEALLQCSAATAVLTVLDAAGRPVSSVLSFYFREVLPYHAGDHASARELAANDFKYWELMRRACERGYRVFDYGRSKRGTGSYDFKKNWGFEPAPLSYEYRLLTRGSVPQNNPLNPRYRAFIALWRRLPIGLCNALGPHIVRNLGWSERRWNRCCVCATGFPIRRTRGTSSPRFTCCASSAATTASIWARSWTTRPTANTCPHCATCAPRQPAST